MNKNNNVVEFKNKEERFYNELYTVARSLQRILIDSSEES